MLNESILHKFNRLVENDLKEFGYGSRSSTFDGETRFELEIYEGQAWYAGHAIPMAAFPGCEKYDNDEEGVFFIDAEYEMDPGYISTNYEEPSEGGDITITSLKFEGQEVNYDLIPKEAFSAMETSAYENAELPDDDGFEDPY